MQLHEVFLIVEDPPTNPQIEPGDILDRAFGDQIGIKLGPDLGDHAAELWAIALGLKCVDLILPARASEVAGQDLLIDFRFQREPGADDDGLDIVVEHHRDQRVFKAGHHDGFVDERVFGPAHAGDIAAQPAFLLFIHIVDDQHFEIGFRQRPRLGRQHRLVVMLVLIQTVAFQRDGAAAIGAGG